MLKCSIESDWKTFYHNAVELVQHEPRAFGDLEEIYNNPSYYSSWYIRSMHENLELNGSVPAEQNHASICAHICNGRNFAICEHINKLERFFLHACVHAHKWLMCYLYCENSRNTPQFFGHSTISCFFILLVSSLVIVEQIFI